MSFLDADYSAIEARITCWLAGQEDALQEYRDDVDRYKVMASVIYRVPPEQVNKHPQRFVGKQATLGCIAEGELVLTDSGLVPIEKVKDWHRVWDGVEWVSHEGLIYQGQKEVITYDGLTATPDHIVFVGMGFERTTDLWSARKQKLGLTISAEGRTPIRTLEAAIQPSIFDFRGVSLCESQMLLRSGGISRPRFIDERHQLGLRFLRSGRSEVLQSPQVAREAHGSCEGSLHEQSKSELQKLRWAGDQVSFPISRSRGELGAGSSWVETSPDVGPEEQQWALRGVESALCHAAGTDTQYTDQEEGLRLLGSRVALFQADDRTVSTTGLHPREDSEVCSSRSSRETQRLEVHSKTVATFDLLNAGPRHRFTVSGKLVHNCGFGMGPDKFRTTCWKMGRYKLPVGLEFTAVEAWRKKHKKVVSYWYDVERAAKNAILQKGKVFEVRKHIKFTVRDVEGMEFLLLRLPSGRKLAYPKPRLCGDRIAFFGNIPMTQKWGDISTWGGCLVENAVQGIAADIMCIGAHNAEREGYQICTLIHDQALAFHGEGQTSDRFVELLTDLPSWADGLPIAAEGGVVPFYKKD